MTEPRDGADVTTPSRLEDLRSDADLLLSTRYGDPAAWDEIFHRYGKLVSSAVRSFRLQEADALDAVQITWQRLIENAHRVQFPERLGGWLVTTARRECLHILRQTKPIPDIIEMASDTIADPSAGPEQRVIDADTARTLCKLVAELSPRRRILLQTLFADHPRPYAEVAHLAGIPLGAIGPTRARVLQQLRNRLEECNLGSGADVAEDVEVEPTQGDRTGSYLLDDLLDEAEQGLREKLESRVTQGTGDPQLDDLLDRADAALRVGLRDHGTPTSGFLSRILDDIVGGVLVFHLDPRVGRSRQPDPFDDITTEVIGTPDVATEDPLDDPPEHSPLLPTLTSLEAWEQRHEVQRLLDHLPPRQRQGLAGALDGYTPAEIAAELTALR
jgi:RNA polymerase sigma factor (sigma-70 family)